MSCQGDELVWMWIYHWLGCIKFPWFRGEIETEKFNTPEVDLD